MQGRLSKKSGKLQSFPWERWREEFFEAKAIGFNQIEWLVDEELVSNNPIASIEGRKEIAELSDKHNIIVNSLCAHSFIDGNLLANYPYSKEAKENFLTLLNYAVQANIQLVCLPVMDKFSLKSFEAKKILKNLLLDTYEDHKDIKILLECDLPADEIKVFLDDVGLKNVRILYDLGNATALGFDIETEIKLLHSYIGEIHLKDRYKDNGQSERLGRADTSFNTVAKVLKKLSWQGNIILETPILDDWREEAKKNYLFAKKFGDSIK